MSIKFSKPSRLDSKKATTGVTFEVLDEWEQSWGKFKLIYANPHARDYELFLKRFRAKYKITQNSTMSAAEIGRLMLIERYLIDWELTDQDGNKIPYSVESAHEYFSDEDTYHVADKLMEYATDVKYFGSVEPVEDILGNSLNSTTGKQSKKTETTSES